MNDNDRHNLDFLLASSKHNIKKWYYTVNKTDHQYAMELLKTYGMQLEAQLAEMSTELMVEAYDDYPEASMVIDRIMKMGV